MKIIINYTGLGIQGYFIEFDLPDEQADKTEEEWKYFALRNDKSDYADTKIIEKFNCSKSSNGIVLDVVLKPRQDFIFSTDILPKFAETLGEGEYQKFRLASKSIRQKVSGFFVFEQSPDTWRSLSQDEIEKAIESLRDYRNIKQLLFLMDQWVENEKSLEYMNAWRATFGRTFTEYYRLLPQPRFFIEEAIFFLVTDNVNELSYEFLNNIVDEVSGAGFKNVGWSLFNTGFYLDRLSRADRLFCEYEAKNLYSNLAGVTCPSKEVEVSRDLISLNASGATFNLLVAISNSWSRIRFSYVDFSKAKLLAAKFHNVAMQHVTFEGANLSGAEIVNCRPCSYLNFSGTNLTNASIKGSDFTAANLTNAIVDEKTVFDNCDFDGADVKGIKWPDGVLSKAKEGAWSILKEKIAKAGPQVLAEIDARNNRPDATYIWDVRRNTFFEKIRVGFFSKNEATTSIQTTNTRIELEKAIDARIALLEQSNIAPEMQTVLKDLKQRRESRLVLDVAAVSSSSSSSNKPGSP